MIDQKLTEVIIGACIEVHRHLGPGLLESAYRQCLVHELMLRGLKARQEVDLPLIYKGVRMECCYKIDILVEDRVILELKSIDKVSPIHEAQLLSYMAIQGARIGLLLNFNVKLMVDGITRRVL